MRRGGAVRGVRLLPRGSLALWQTEFVDAIAGCLLARAVRRDVMLLSPIQGGLTTFLTGQLAPAISALARWIYLPLGQFACLPPQEAVNLAWRSLAIELDPDFRASFDTPVMLDPPIRELVDDRDRIVIIAVDDAHLRPQVTESLRCAISGAANVRLLAGTHRPLPGPFTPMLLPGLSLDQIAAMIGVGHTSEEIELLAWWSGRCPPLVRDLAMATEAGLPGKPWRDWLAAAASKLCDDYDCNPYAVSLRNGASAAERRFLAAHARGTAVGDYPAARALIHLGVLHMSKPGKLEFVSPIVKHWFTMEETSDLCRVMTEKGSRVVPAPAAHRLLEGARRRLSTDPHLLVVDARAPANIWFRTRTMKPGDDVVAYLRLLCESRTASAGRLLTVLYPTVGKLVPNVEDPRKWVYGVKHKIVSALGPGLVEVDWGAGSNLSEKIGFLWVEPFAP